MADPTKNRSAFESAQTGWNPTGQSITYDANGQVQPTAYSYDSDVNYQRDRGARFQPTPQLDLAQSNQSRGVQMGALGLLRAQANGTAPSSAQILSQRANQEAGHAAGQSVAGGRGVGASLAAFGGANAASSNAALGANVQGANARAGEISRGQGSFTSGAGDVRRGDIGAAATNAQLEQEQRALNERHQQAAEQLGWDVRNQGMQNAGRYLDLEKGGYLAERKAEEAKEQQKFNIVKDAASTVTGGLTLGMGGTRSDPRTKMHMGSLGSLTRKGY